MDALYIFKMQKSINIKSTALFSRRTKRALNEGLEAWALRHIPVWTKRQVQAQLTEIPDHVYLLLVHVSPILRLNQSVHDGLWPAKYSVVSNTEGTSRENANPQYRSNSLNRPLQPGKQLSGYRR
jgi:hypothetical protein